jgi:hypothetical protein
MSTEELPDVGVSAIVQSAAPDPQAMAALEARPFIESLPEEYRSAKWAENFSKSENPWHALAKSYANAEQQIGKLANRVAIPGENASPEELQAFRKAIGVPDSADAYEYKAPDLSGEPEAVQALWKENANEELSKVAKAKAHELGLTPKQFAGMAEMLDRFNLNMVKSLVEAAAQHETQRQQAEIEAFKKVFGERAEGVRELAKQTLSKIGLPQEFANSPDAALIFAMDYIHRNVFANDKVGGGAATPGRTPQQIRAEIMKLRDNPAYQNKYPFEEFKRIHDQLDALYKEEYELTMKQ